MDGGTLYQLRNILNRRDVVQHPKDNMNACEEFFLLATEAHILSAAMTTFEMSSATDIPSKSFFPDESSQLSSLERRKLLLQATEQVVDKFVDVSFGMKQPTPEDHVTAYACELLKFGLLLMEFNDAVREGDGERIMRCWRYFLLIFKVSGNNNYAIEAFTLLSQYTFILSPRSAMQLKWNRTVNVHGRPGKNVSCDLHLEHLNREAKNSLMGLGSNITDNAVQRVGKCIGHTIEIVKQFDRTSAIKETSGRRSKLSCTRDMKLLLRQLHENAEVFEPKKERAHRNFPTFAGNITQHISLPELQEWMGKQLHKIINY